MQASTAFGQTAADSVRAMSVGEILALPLDGAVTSLIRASAMVTVCSWNGQIGRISRPALQDLRAVSEAHCRMDLHGAPVINVLRSTLDMFLDAWAVSEPHGPGSEGLPDTSEVNMEVAMHLLGIVQTPEQRRSVYNEAVQCTLRSNAALLLEMTPAMQADAPPAVLGVVGLTAERALIQNHYTEVRGLVVAVLDTLQGMQITRYRFRTILNELVSNVLLVLVRAVMSRLATAYHQAVVNMANVYELIDELVTQHLALQGLVVTRLQQHCSDANVFIKHNPASVNDHPTYNGAQVTARLQEARTAVDFVHTVFQGELQAAFEGGPIVHAMAVAHAALEEMNHFMDMVDDDAPAVNPAAMQAVVDGVMAQATVVHLMEEEDCAACMMPSNEMVLCHGCQRSHCCVACTRHIIQMNPFAPRCPVCRSTAFPVPVVQQHEI